MLITRTPLRISLLGGGSDYPGFFKKHGGLVLGGAIDKYSYIMARQLPPYHDFKSRFVYSHIETVGCNTLVDHRAIKACINATGLMEAGLEVSHMADMPSRSGTGSSSTFVVGLLHAFNALQGRHLSPKGLANFAIEVEQKRMGECVGCQDQIFASFGGFNIVRFHRAGYFAVYPVPITPYQLAELEQHLALFYTKLPRTSSAVAKSYVPTITEKSGQMQAIMRLAEEGIEAVQRSEWERLGRLMHNSWLIKRQLSRAVSSPQIDELYARAQVGGALGGKLTGAGGGGCLLFVLKDPSCRSRVASLLSDCVPIDFRFDHDGSRVIFHD